MTTEERAPEALPTAKAPVPAPPAPRAEEEDHGEVHVLPLRMYLLVYGSLLALTAVTVGVSVAGLGKLAIAAALTVAVIKAGLVVGYFMHLKYDVRFYALAFFSSLIFVGLFLGLTMVDMTTRADVNPEEGTFYKAKEDRARKEAREKERKAMQAPTPPAR
jgi:cytochrome c oxidase subunit 4